MRIIRVKCTERLLAVFTALCLVCTISSVSIPVMAAEGEQPAPGIAADNGYLVITDIEEKPIEYTEENKEAFGVIQYSVSTSGDADWTDMPTTDSIEKGEAGSKYKCYKIPAGTTRLRIYSKSNYTSSVRDSSGVQDNGNDFHGLLVNSQQTVTEQGTQTPVILEPGTVIGEMNYNIEPDQIGGSSKPFTSVRATIITLANIASTGFNVRFNPHNILWYNDAAYAGKNGGDDAVITGGTVEFVSCRMDPDDATDTGLTGNNNGIIRDSNNNPVGYCYSAKEGAILTLKFIPDYGYQFKEAAINGNTVEPQNDDYTFKFKFPQGTFHMSVEFVPGYDKTFIGNNAPVASASVTGPEGLNVNGNLLLTVAGNDPSAETKTAVADTLDSGFEIEDYVSLDLESYAEKGAAADTAAGITAQNSWTQDQTELNKNVEISLTLDPDLRDSNAVYSVVRAHESEGTASYTEIPATYNASTGTLSFSSNQFSTYAIAKKHVDPAYIPCSHAITQQTVTKKASFSDDGTITTTCQSCGTLISTEKIAKVSDVLLSSGKYTYSGEKQTPDVTVKDSRGNALRQGSDYSLTYPQKSTAAGSYNVKVILKGSKYTGTLTKHYYIRPKGTLITKASAAVIRWKAQKTQTSGYQLQYSISRTFDKELHNFYVKDRSRTGLSLNGLKTGNTYYVKVRTYKNVPAGKKTIRICSGWSTIRSFKVR